MATDLRGHTVPAPGEFVDFNAINQLSASINATKSVANMTEAAQYIAALEAASLPTNGAMVFNQTDNKYYGRVGGAWEQARMGVTPVRRLNKPASQSIPNGVPTLLSWVAAAGDDGNSTGITYSAGLLTVSEAGVYQINSTLMFDGRTGGTRELNIRVNGVQSESGFAFAPAGLIQIPVSAAARLAAGSTIGIYATQNSGSSLNTYAGAAFTTWSVARIS